MAATSNGLNGNGKSAAMLLQESSCPAMKKVQVTETEKSVTLRGTITFIHTKQLAASLVEPCLAGREFVNEIAVLGPVDPEEMSWWKPPIPLEVRVCALKDINEQEIMAEIREMRRGGGFELRDFIDELERACSK